MLLCEHCFGIVVFKVIGIEESAFVEKTNLRVGRINLNFSITDVQWHPFEGTKFFSKISLEQGCHQELGTGDFFSLQFPLSPFFKFIPPTPDLYPISS